MPFQQFQQLQQPTGCGTPGCGGEHIKYVDREVIKYVDRDVVKEKEVALLPTLNLPPALPPTLSVASSRRRRCRAGPGPSPGPAPNPSLNPHPKPYPPSLSSL